MQEETRLVRRQAGKEVTLIKLIEIITTRHDTINTNTSLVNIPEASVTNAGMNYVSPVLFGKLMLSSSG